MPPLRWTRVPEQHGCSWHLAESKQEMPLDAQTMLRTAVVLLAITALGGLLMAGLRFSGHPRPPSSIAMLHGLLAASGT